MTQYFAHSPNGTDRTGVWEPLLDHLKHVADLAASFASPFGAEQQANLAGRLHDLGKYADQFQCRLKDPGEPGKDHWTIGALAALQTGKLGLLPAISILGHHVGLEELSSQSNILKSSLSKLLRTSPERFTSKNGAELIQRFKADGLEFPTVSAGLLSRHDYAGDMLDARMLFSALVDADFLETEAHFNGDETMSRRPRKTGPQLDVDRCLTAFGRYVEKVEARYAEMADHPFISLRRQLLRACNESGQAQSPGIFTLSAPTGAGKTLAMLGFALEHAKRHGLRRIVLVMPFLNIIDQTAQIYREIFRAEEFGEHFVLESHSLAGGDPMPKSTTEGMTDGSDPATIRRRLLTENWDAPIVLTTNVQLLESLFAHKPSACRKLHRLAGSILLFDEVQTLPPHLAVATLAALNRLGSSTGPYRTSIVFATATQPAFDVLSDRLGGLVDRQLYGEPPPQWTPREVVTNSDELFAEASGRVWVEWREQTPITFSDLAEELADRQQVLCIVNLKRHAKELGYQVMSRASDVFHLSTNMCSRHRQAVLGQVARRLKDGRPVRLIATQCVEAGVDLDFPIVYRALAPLEAIAQAAGRCNRSGFRPEAQVVVFLPDDKGDSGQQRRIYPPGYQTAVKTTQLLLSALRLDHPQDLPELVSSPKHLRRYYQMLYGLEGRSSGLCEDERPILNAIELGNFPEASAAYRLINQDVINVLVPYDSAQYERLLTEATGTGKMTIKQVRNWQRLARPYSVSVYRPENPQHELFLQMLPISFGAETDEARGPTTADIDWWYPAEGDGYDSMIGLDLAEPQWVM